MKPAAAKRPLVPTPRPATTCGTSEAGTRARTLDDRRGDRGGAAQSSTGTNPGSIAVSRSSQAGTGRPLLRRNAGSKSFDW